MLKKLRRRLEAWWECRSKRCTYYMHYLAYGPAHLTHDGFHAAERLADAHWRNCRHDWSGSHCSACLSWEERLRA